MIGGGHIRLNPYGLLLVIVSSLIFLLVWYGDSSGTWYIEQGERGLSVNRLLRASILLAERGGKVIREIHNSERLNVHVKDRTRELVTEADLKSHKTIVHGFKKAFPKLRVISEEKTTEDDVNDLENLVPLFDTVSIQNHNDFFVANKDVTVWVDPLDATQEFTEGYLDCVSVMICVAIHGHPLVGVLHMPFSNITYWGWRGYGQSNSVTQLLLTAERQRKLHSNQSRTLLLSRSHPSHMMQSFEHIFGKDMSILKLGGVGFKTLRLMDGTGNVYLHQGAIRKWDVCASHALLSAAGGRLTDLNGAQVRYESSLPHRLEAGLLASATLLDHEAYIKRFKEEITDKLV